MAVEVRLKDLVKSFDTTFAIDHVTFQIDHGELFFLLGPSGCGKTTCLRTIAGFYQPDHGELFFGDQLMNGIPPNKRNTGMVFQNYALWPHMNVYQNVEYGLTIRKISAEIRKEKVAEALEIVQMESYIDRPVNTLSGGQQQRVALARALVIEPDVLLLDEPLSNLDAKLRLEMRNEIKRIHDRSGITAVYVTHDQAEALSLADRMAVMKDGKIVQIGTPHEVYRSPANKFVASFIGETNFVGGIIRSEASIDTPIGQLKTDRKHDFAEDQSVVCSIRPEAIQITTKTAPDLPNQFSAEVESVVYLGWIEEYHLTVDGKIRLKSSVYNPRSEVNSVGDKVRCWIDPKDVVILDREN